MTYTQNGESYIEDKGHAVLLPLGGCYHLHCEEGGLFPVINFQCRGLKCDTILSIPVDNAEELVKEYEKMRAMKLFDETGFKTFGAFYGILDKIAYAAEYQPLAPAISYIENNYGDPELNNGQLAAMCQISEVYFRKLFSKRYKVTPRQFIIDVRIGKAKELLSEGRLKISVIAETCGFSNPYHFCRSFKEQTGLTPTEYMMKNRMYRI